MAFEGLSDRLESAFQRLKSKGSLTEADVKAAMREVRMALLEADVNYKVAKDFTKTVTERAVGEKVMESLTPAQMVIKIVNEELTNLMGGTKARLAIANHPPTVVMMCGLQGSGKTTHTAKIALMLKNQGHRPLLVACDIYRPALSNSFRLSANRQVFPFLRWVRPTRLRSQPKQSSSQKTKVMTMSFSIRQVVFILTKCLWRSSKT